MNLNTATGAITGTPTVASTSNFTIEVTSAGQSDRLLLSITVHPTLAVTATSLPDGVQNLDYGTETLAATGGTLFANVHETRNP